MRQLRIPEFSRVPGLERFLRDLMQVVSDEFSKRTRDDTVRRSVLLKSTDDNTVWEITIDGTGTISTTKVSG